MTYDLYARDIDGKLNAFIDMPLLDKNGYWQNITKNEGVEIESEELDFISHNDMVYSKKLDRFIRPVAPNEPTEKEFAELVLLYQSGETALLSDGSGAVYTSNNGQRSMVAKEYSFMFFRFSGNKKNYQKRYYDISELLYKSSRLNPFETFVLRLLSSHNIKTEVCLDDPDVYTAFGMQIPYKKCVFGEIVSSGEELLKISDGEDVQFVSPRRMSIVKRRSESLDHYKNIQLKEGPSLDARVGYAIHIENSISAKREQWHDLYSSEMSLIEYYRSNAFSYLQYLEAVMFNPSSGIHNRHKILHVARERLKSESHGIPIEFSYNDDSFRNPIHCLLGTLKEIKDVDHKTFFVIEIDEYKEHNDIIFNNAKTDPLDNVIEISFNKISKHDGSLYTDLNLLNVGHRDFYVYYKNSDEYQEGKTFIEFMEFMANEMILKTKGTTYPWK